MDIFDKIKSGGRIAECEAIALWDSPLFDLARAANLRRAQLDPSGEAGYIVNRMLNYSNVCNAGCKFCAYHAKAGRVAPYRLSDDEIFDICSDVVSRGAVQLMFEGGLHPDFTLDWAEGVLRRIKSAFPSLWLHVFSPSEIVSFAKGAGVSVFECVSCLKNAGADSVPGAADILVPRVRKAVCGNKCTVAEWEEVMRSLARLGMYSSATMTFGLGETVVERIEHLALVRELQDETGVFKAFIAWPVAPENTDMERVVRRVGAPEFLRTLAVSRIFLDNIKYVQSGWLTEGLRVAEVALAFGANDVGGVLMDEKVVRAAGVDDRANAENMRRAISNAGFVPRERDGLYNTIKTF